MTNQTPLIMTPLGPLPATRDQLAKLKRARELGQRQQRQRFAQAERRSPLWTPFPPKNGKKSPQAQALESLADILGFGGAAGGGKTDLELGAAITQHRRSIILRREFTQLIGVGSVIERSKTILAGHATFKASPRPMWEIPGGRSIEFGAAQHVGDEIAHQGKRRDLWCFDELTHFAESQFRFLLGWLGSDIPGQRVRAIGGFNPPTTQEGQWVIDYFAPWLDPQHPNPAQPGELRWYATLAGKDVERPNGLPFEFDGEIIEPMSRTFIPSHVEDNPVLMATGYRRSLQALPEPLRSLMLKGSFDAAIDDDPWQVIPTKWVQAAQLRWAQSKAAGFKPAGPPDAVGVDVARGGKDETVYTPRHGVWFAEQIIKPGKSTPDGQSVIRDAVPLLADSKGALQVDVIGVGSSPVDIAKLFTIRVMILNGSQKSLQMDRHKKLRFANKRSEWAWKLREALDPDTGEKLEIPPDRRILSDLCSMRWELKSTGIALLPKDDIKDLIGRSPDRGESIIYAHAKDHDTPPITGAIVIEGRRSYFPGG